MKSLFLVAGFVLLTHMAALAQDKLNAKAAGGKITVAYEVQPKESLYALSRKFNVKVADLAAANAFDKNKNLTIGEKIYIPLQEQNFNQTNKKGTPVYYAVGEKEGLMTVSKKFNNVSLKTLRSWNNLKKDELAKGQSIVIGYMTVDVATTTAVAGKEEKSKVEKTTDAKKAEQPAPATAKTKKEITPKPAAKQNDKKETLKENTAAAKVVEEKLTAKKEQESLAAEVAAPLPDREGAFKKTYTHTAATDQSVTSGIFKTNKGWSDYKYYILMEGVAPGTVVKLLNPLNDKVAYAKVLGSLSDTRSGNEYQVRISDAAASWLGIMDTEKFSLQVSR